MDKIAFINSKIDCEFVGGELSAINEVLVVLCCENDDDISRN